MKKLLKIILFFLFATNASAAQVKDIIKPNAPASGCETRSQEGFAKRFYNTYKEHLKYTGENVAELEHNKDAVSPPLSSPPFPSATWNIGGTTPIGYADNTVAPLMDAIYCGENGQKIKDSRIKLYGWIDPGANLSSSKSHYDIASGTGGNYPRPIILIPIN